MSETNENLGAQYKRKDVETLKKREIYFPSGRKVW